MFPTVTPPSCECVCVCPCINILQSRAGGEADTLTDAVREREKGREGEREGASDTEREGLKERGKEGLK